MAAREFKSKLESTNRPRKFPSQSSLTFMGKMMIKLPTVMLVGALLQVLLFTILPARWAIVPPAVLLLNSVITTLLQMWSPKSNAFMEGVVHGRVTSQLADAATGKLGPDPASSSLVVFNLGAQFNHPLGFFAPGADEVKYHSETLTRELLKRREEFGLISFSTWQGIDRDANPSMNTSYYFKNVDGIHRFAHDKLHRAAWEWYSPSKFPHLGLCHETFCVPARGYETLYLNCRPLLLGQGSIKYDSKDGEQWVSTLVSADTPTLKSQYARLGRDANGVSKYQSVDDNGEVV